MNDSPSSANTPDPFDLQKLPSTDVLRSALDRMTGRLQQLVGADETLRHRAEIAIKYAQDQVALGERRDSLQAGRPAGCWCLGTGGTERRYMPPWDGEGELVEVLSRYCTCEEAVARRTQDEVNREYQRVMAQEHRARQIFNGAGVPVRFKDATFDTYPVSATTREAYATVKQWAESGTESLLLYGPFGTGKTGLAIAAMRYRITAHHPGAMFLTTPGLLDRIRQTYSRQRDEIDEADVLEAVRNTGLLVLDDLGAERPTDWVQEKLFTIINDRHDALAPTIFTSNLDPEGLARHLGERIAWRIIEMSEVVKVDGPNLRDRQ